MARWGKYGLAAPGWFRTPEPEPRYAALSPAARFRLALEESGGLFPWFGHFLAGRSDLLSSAYLYELRKIRMPELPAAGPPPGELTALVADLQLMRTTPGCEIYSGSHLGKQVVVEVARKGYGPDSPKEWELFHRGLRQIHNRQITPAIQDAVVEQFQSWLRLQADLERKRTMLGNLQNTPSYAVTRFPKLVPELQSSEWMGYEGAEGYPVSRLLSEPGSKADGLHVLAEGFLEQCLLFALIDAEFQPEELLLLKEGRLGFRTVPSWVAVPVESHQDLLQYVVAAVGGETPRAVQMLCRISAGRDAYRAEERLLHELSSLQPELKINAVTPESVTALETYGRAMHKSALRPPLFLQLFHRNITLLGQHNELLDPAVDVLDEALWPVLGRLLRFHLGEMMSSGKLQEWAVSSSLFLMTAGRQMTVLLEKIRENDPRITSEAGVRIQEPRHTALNRRTTALLRSAILLVVLLVSLQLSMSLSGGALPALAGLAATAAAIALCFSVAGIR
ncbi:MAG TPA: hypothetical protein VNN17_08895 [Terriglobia bacterium]|nr:hypothetical protein [Terriglobia bacterium]